MEQVVVFILLFSNMAGHGETVQADSQTFVLSSNGT